MPLLVSCDDLQPGMRLAEAFLFRGRTMLPGGKTLSPEDVDILRRKYPEAMLKVGDPVLDSVVQFENDSREIEVATTVTQQITSAMADVQQRLANHTNLSGIDFGGIRNTVSSVIDYLRNNPVSAALINRMKSDESYLAEHAGNVFYLAMVLGSGVKDYVVKERQRQTAASSLSTALAMDLMPLGLGAMLMDVGMTPLQHLFKPGYVLTDEDRAALVEHPTRPGWRCFRTRCRRRRRWWCGGITRILMVRDTRTGSRGRACMCLCGLRGSAMRLMRRRRRSFIRRRRVRCGRCGR